MGFDADRLRVVPVLRWFFEQILLDYYYSSKGSNCSLWGAGRTGRLGAVQLGLNSRPRSAYVHLGGGFFEYLFRGCGGRESPAVLKIDKTG
jgi:hypothetical protein